MRCYAAERAMHVCVSMLYYPRYADQPLCIIMHDMLPELYAWLCRCMCTAGLCACLQNYVHGVSYVWLCGGMWVTIMRKYVVKNMFSYVNDALNMCTSIMYMRNRKYASIMRRYGHWEKWRPVREKRRLLPTIHRHSSDQCSSDGGVLEIASRSLCFVRATCHVPGLWFVIRLV